MVAVETKKFGLERIVRWDDLVFAGCHADRNLAKMSEKQTTLNAHRNLVTSQTIPQKELDPWFEHVAKQIEGHVPMRKVHGHLFLSA
jgi:hypothetical protein